MRMNPPGSDEPYDGSRMERFIDVDKEYYVMKMEGKTTKPKKVALKNRLG